MDSSTNSIKETRAFSVLSCIFANMAARHSQERSGPQQVSIFHKKGLLFLCKPHVTRQRKAMAALVPCAEIGST